MQSYLNWDKINSMLFNITKTPFLSFGETRDCFSLNIGYEIVQPANTVENLCIGVSEKPKLNVQILRRLDLCFHFLTSLKKCSP